MKNIQAQDIKQAINTLLKKGNEDGVVYQEVATLNDGRKLCLVMGYQEGYEKEAQSYQRIITTLDGKNTTTLTICAKLAINIDDLQADYNMDWYMPSTKEGDVYDTDSAIIGTDYQRIADDYNKEAETIVESMNNGNLVLE